MKQRLDQALTQRGLTTSRSQAENLTKLGYVKVNDRMVVKPAMLVAETDKVSLVSRQKYVSRAALKLASVAKLLGVDLTGENVLGVGSSTGGFTDYALQHGTQKVIAVDVGTDQMSPALRINPKVELHEKTDIRDFSTQLPIDIVVIDVSFISIREIMPAILRVCSPTTEIVAMIKPQFETQQGRMKNKGVIKNDRLRRYILKDFESWVGQQARLIIKQKADSLVAGEKGNLERFYLLSNPHKGAQLRA